MLATALLGKLMKLADLADQRTACKIRRHMASRVSTTAAVVHVLFLLLCFGGPGESAKLLLVPLASESHIAAFTALSTALEQHGSHEIHMVGDEALIQVYIERNLHIWALQGLGGRGRGRWGVMNAAATMYH